MTPLVFAADFRDFLLNSLPILIVIAAVAVVYTLQFGRLENVLELFTIRFKRMEKELDQAIERIGQKTDLPTPVPTDDDNDAPSKLVRVLAIDGGGIRGILPARVLVELERILQQEDHNPRARIADYFDLVAGTSAGGILTCLHLQPSDRDLHRPQYSAEEIVDIYKRLGQCAYQRPRWPQWKTIFSGPQYAEQRLEDMIYQYMGDLEMSLLLKPCLVTAYDTARRQPFFFTQHMAQESPEENFYVADVVRSTSAAPPFFRPSLIRPMVGQPRSMVDGCLFANNPSMCAYAEARKLPFPDRCPKPTAREMAVLSLGTGRVEKAYLYRQVRSWGKIRWIGPLIDVLTTANSDTVDYQLGKMFDAVRAPGQYLRIEPELGNASAEIDDASRRNIARLEQAGEDCAFRYADELRRFARYLIEET